jgi:hypothetical protein
VEFKANEKCAFIVQFRAPRVRLWHAPATVFAVANKQRLGRAANNLVRSPFAKLRAGPSGRPQAARVPLHPNTCSRSRPRHAERRDCAPPGPRGRQTAGPAQRPRGRTQRPHTRLCCRAPRGPHDRQRARLARRRGGRALRPPTAPRSDTLRDPRGRLQAEPQRPSCGPQTQRRAEPNCPVPLGPHRRPRAKPEQRLRGRDGRLRTARHSVSPYPPCVRE